MRERICQMIETEHGRYVRGYTPVGGSWPSSQEVDAAETSRQIVCFLRAVLEGVSPADAYKATSESLKTAMQAAAKRRRDYRIQPDKDHGQDRLFAAYLVVVEKEESP